ncbi:hypothetical protein [Acidihalobacter prosperus]
MKYSLFTAVICLLCTNASTQLSAINRVRLPSGRYGQIIDFDANLVTCSVDNGYESCGWADLDFPRSCNIKTNDCLRFDQRVITNKTDIITRTLISIKAEGTKWQSYLIDRYDNSYIDPLTGKRVATTRKVPAYLGPAYFIDNNTVVFTPNYSLIAYRDYNHDGKDEVLSAFRTAPTQNGQLVPEASQNMPLIIWTCTFKAWGNSYSFRYDQNYFPLIPEPNPKPGFVNWGKNEYSLENLLIEGSDTLIRYPIKQTSKQHVDPAPDGSAQNLTSGCKPESE